MEERFRLTRPISVVFVKASAAYLKKQSFVEHAAAFFARNLKEAYQIRSIEEVVNAGRPWPTDMREAEHILVLWLNDKNTDDRDTMETLLEGFTASVTKTKTKRDMAHATARPQDDVTDADAVVDLSEASATKDFGATELLYGNDGKREGVRKFLTELCDLGTPQTILLYSSEDMAWLYEDSVFSKQWTALLSQFVENGGHIRIIHTTNRDVGEMFEAVSRWLPLYMSGAIEPYYYPKLRDGTCRRTLFVGLGQCALISNSVETRTQTALNMFLHDKDAVHALEEEFEDFCALCKPLMKVFTKENREQFWPMMDSFEESCVNLIMASNVPSNFTVPQEVAQRLAQRAGNDLLATRYAMAHTRAMQQLEAGLSITEILYLPDLSEVIAGEVPVLMGDLLGVSGLCYEPDEFFQHIERVIELLRTQENYEVVFSDRNLGNVALFAKEDLGAVITSRQDPTIVFGVSEQNMTAAIWDYLCRGVKKTRREDVISQLEDYVGALRKRA